HEVGPDLAAQAGKSPAYWLTEIFDPNRNVDSRYVQYTAVTRRGRTLVGLLTSETATSVTLRAQEGKEEVLLRAELEELASSGKSLMPEGLKKALSKQDVADLIAYVNVITPPPRRFPGNRPEVVKVANGGYALLATNAEIHGKEIVFEEPFRNLGYWH